MADDTHKIEEYHGQEFDRTHLDDLIDYCREMGKSYQLGGCHSCIHCGSGNTFFFEGSLWACIHCRNVFTTSEALGLTHTHGKKVYNRSQESAAITSTTTQSAQDLLARLRNKT